jgi:hypothetical protein
MNKRPLRKLSVQLVPQDSFCEAQWPDISQVTARPKRFELLTPQSLRGTFQFAFFEILSTMAGRT